MRRPSLVVGTAVLASVLSALLVPPAAHAVDSLQNQVVSGTAVTWTPKVVDGQVSALVAVGADIVIGGTFTQVQNAGGGTVYSRRNIAAFNATTGLVDTAFAPTLDGPVNTLDTFGGTIVAGGAFATVNGVAQRGITQLTLAGVRVSTFTAHIDGTSSLVDTVVARGARLFVGGRFTKVDGVARTSLAVLNASTGALDAMNVPATGTVKVGQVPFVATLDVTPDGRTLVIGGNFTSVGGLPRTQLAIVDAVAGKVTTWQTAALVPACIDPNVISPVRELTIAADGSYFVVVAGGGPMTGSLCDSASRWELGRTGTGQQPTWVDSTGGDSLYSVAITGTAVYVGGHQRWMNNYAGSNSAGPGAVDRKMVAALDPLTGLPLSWNPAVTRGGTAIFDMLATPTGLWVGSDTDTAFGGAHFKIVFFPLAGGTPFTQVRPATLPRSIFVATTGGTLLQRPYDGTLFGATSLVPGSGGIPWASLTGAFIVGTDVYYGTPDGVLHKVRFVRGVFATPTVVSTWWSLAGVKSFTFDNGRLYYGTGDGKLYYRWFLGESDLVGSQAITVASTGYADAGEMFVVSGNLYFARADQRLYRVALTAGVPTGAATAVSGPGIDTLVWGDRAAFVASTSVGVHTVPPGQPVVTGPGGHHQPAP